MIPWLGRNLAVAACGVAAWTGLAALELRLGHAGPFGALSLVGLLALSVAYWWVNRPLVARFASPEAGVLWLGAVAAVLTAATVAAGALASAALKAWWLHS